ncbi:MAG: excinuclease ABC subunit A, partial [Phycisphaeraceae bacterium]|nr:excinuclease ABC subunit A [Phycisphaeraceae bacterium]
MAEPSSTISIRGAAEHNLQEVDIDIPRNRLVVVTGLSGSGKSSLAFDTIYAEGQRKYVESLSAYARQFLDQLQKPKVESSYGLPPTIAIEQRSASHNPRSTVATTTEIYDYLRLLYARVGRPRCWHIDDDGEVCGKPIESQSATQIIDQICEAPEGTRLMILAPLVRGKKGHHKDIFAALNRQGFVRARVDGELMDLREIDGETPFTTKKERYQQHTVEAVVDRVVIRGGDEADEVRSRIADSVEQALKLAGGMLVASFQEPDADRSDPASWQDQLFSERYACADHGDYSLEELEPRLFSFNSPYGACPECDGLGNILEFDPELVVPDPSRSISDGAIEAWRKHGRRMNIYYSRMIRKFCKTFEIDKDEPFKSIGQRAQRILLHGTNDRDEKEFGGSFEGVIPNLQRRWENTDSEYVKKKLHNYLSESDCEHCRGARLRRASRFVFLPAREAAEVARDEGSGKVFGEPGLYNLPDVSAMTVERAAAFFERVTLNQE